MEEKEGKNSTSVGGGGDEVRKEGRKEGKRERRRSGRKEGLKWKEEGK